MDGNNTFFTYGPKLMEIWYVKNNVVSNFDTVQCQNRKVCEKTAKVYKT